MTKTNEQKLLAKAINKHMSFNKDLVNVGTTTRGETYISFITQCGVGENFKKLQELLTSMGIQYKKGTHYRLFLDSAEKLESLAGYFRII